MLEALCRQSSTPSTLCMPRTAADHSANIEKSSPCPLRSSVSHRLPRVVGQRFARPCQRQAIQIHERHRDRARALQGRHRRHHGSHCGTRTPKRLLTRTRRSLGVLSGYTVWSASFAPGVHFETNSDLCATAYCAAGLRSTSRAIASTMSAGTPRRPVARGNFIVFVCPPRGGQVCCL